MTDHGDYNTFRFVLDNDIEVKAALSGNIKPWQDSARFVKIAWRQEPAPMVCSTLISSSNMT